MSIAYDDNEALMPLMREERYTLADKERPFISKTIVLNNNMVDEKKKYPVRIFSGTVDEDLVCLMGTISEFQKKQNTFGM